MLALLGVTVAALGTPVGAAAAPTPFTNVTVGTPTAGITARSNVDTRTNFSVVDTGQPVTMAGSISRLDFYAQATGSLEIFLTNSSNTVKYVTPLITVTTTGLKSFEIPAAVPVVPGDQIGFYANGASVIPFDNSGGTTSQTGPGGVFPTVGSPLPAFQNVGLIRTYSLGGTATRTQTTVASSMSPSAPGQSVTFTAASDVTTNGMGSPSASQTYSFTSDGVLIPGCDQRPIPDANTNRPWHATCTTTTLSPGTHAIVATYSGGASTVSPWVQNGSVSPAFSQIVSAATTPTCVVTAVRRTGTLSGHAEQDVTVSDPSGLTSITNVSISNGMVFTGGPLGTRIDPGGTTFTGNPTSVVLTAVKATAGIATVWSFDATNTQGNTKHCV